MKLLRFLFLLAYFLICGQVLLAQTQIGDPIDGILNDGLGDALAISGDGTRIAIGAPSESLFGLGYVRIYEIANGSLTQLGSDLKGTQGTRGNFGARLAFSKDGGYLAVSTTRSDDVPARVQVYEYDGNDWEPFLDPIDSPNTDDFFGAALAISRDSRVVAVGAPFADVGSEFTTGEVRVYRISGNDWQEIGYFSGNQTRQLYGSDVAFADAGKRLVIGSPQTDVSTELRNAGSVEIYDYDGTDWSLKGEAINGSEQNERFGGSVTITPTGERLAIGATRGSGIGLVRAYNQQGDKWVQRGNTLTGTAAGSDFGTDVAISEDGDFLAIGDPDADGAGEIQLFELEGVTWSPVGDPFMGTEDFDGAGEVLDLQNGLLAYSLPGFGSNSDGRTFVFELGELVSLNHPLAPQVSIYPNPTVNELTITGARYSSARVVDMQGRVVLETTLPNATSIDVSRLVSGAYFLQLRVEGEWLSKWFVRG